MRRVFADTFYFLALLNPRNMAHPRALAFSRTFGGQVITTAWVLTEVGDAFADPRTRPSFLQTLTQLRGDPQVQFVAPDLALFDDGIALYESSPDKEWSLTDCISFVVMQREQITEALTGDHHFEQAGFIALLK
jgi:predicted nucleic acid-binding protein